jgi:hypothetical protein
MGSSPSMMFKPIMYVMSPPDEFIAFVRAEIAKWARVVRETNIEVE